MTHSHVCRESFIRAPWLLVERWGPGVEYHFQEFNEPYAPS